MATVLVVDDEPIVREVVVRYLEREGYATLEADDGDDARVIVERDSPDLVVLDVMLPGTDGLELCRWIRSRTELPVIMLTARGEEADRIVGLELGADDYVTKPFSPRELAARVRTVLRRTNAAAAATERVSFGDVELDAATRDVRKAGADVRLTAKEFDLLWFLASHPATRVRTRSAHEPRLGIRGSARHGHGHRARPAPAREDRGRPIGATPSPDRLGRRLPAGAVMPLAMIETAIAVGALTLAVGLVAVVLAAAPPEPPPAARRARRTVGVPSARVRPALRLGRVPHGRRREDPGRLGRFRGRGGRRRAAPRPVDLPVGRARPDGVGRARRGRPPRARSGVGTGRGRRPRRLVQRDGRQPRAPVRRAPRARRVGEPRPPDAAREHAGDARGARGRSRPGRDDHADPSRAGRPPLIARRRPLRARAHRRRRAHPGTARRAARAGRRVVPPGRGGGRAATRHRARRERPRRRERAVRAREGRARARRTS